jgi:protein SOK2
MMPHGSEQVAAPPAGSEGEHDHDNEYTHSSAPYNGNRAPYGYNPNGPPGGMHPDHAHLSPEMTGSPHQNGSGRATPRSAAPGQAQWNSGYPTPQRQAPPSSNLYNVMSDPRGAPNGNATHDAYQGPGAVSQYASQGYPPNGVPTSGKRGRDEEDQDPYRPDSVQGDDMGGMKRRKTMEGAAVGPTYADPSPGIQRAHTMTAQRARR